MHTTDFSTTATVCIWATVFTAIFLKSFAVLCVVCKGHKPKNINVNVIDRVKLAADGIFSANNG